MYTFYLDGMELPITPSKLKIKINGKNETMTLISGKEINLLKTPGLSDVEFEMLLPQVQYSFASKLQPVEYYTEKLKKLMANKIPCQFLVSRTLPNGQLLFGTDMKVSIEDYEINEDAANGFDVTVNVKLKQYEEYAAHSVDVSEIAGKTVVTTVAERPVSTNAPSVKDNQYTVKPGDTLWAICKKNLGNGDLYKDIAAFNDIANPNAIKIGQVIRFG